MQKRASAKRRHFQFWRGSMRVRVEGIVSLLESSRPFSAAERQKIYKVREILDKAGFCEENTLRLLGIPFFPPARERRKLLPGLLEHTNGGRAPETFVRLFTLGHPVPIDLVRKAVAPMEIEDWEGLGLIRVEGGNAHGTLELCQCGDVVAAADWPGSVGKDEVMELAASSRALLQMTIRRPVDSALDLGTGCGIQSIMAARHCRRVTASDVNSRAIRLAEFNSILNKVSNIDFSTGSLFEPVEGRKFDLIVCNPPFVIGPGTLCPHTSTGQSSDQFCETIVRQIPAHLTENGFAQVVCNWAQVGDETSQEHVGHWFEDSGCDAWVLHSHAEPATDYARARAEENAPDPSGVDRLYDEWMACFERENITAVNFGLINLRRSSSHANWVRYDELPGARGVCGRSIELGFLLRDFLETHRDDRQMLGTRLRRAPDLTFLKGQANGSRSGTARVRHEQGLTFTATIDQQVADFICNCRGNTPLRDHAQKIARKNHVPVPYLLPSFLMVVRHLIELGFLLPVEIISKFDR